MSTFLLCVSAGATGGMKLLATYRSTGLPAVMFEADGTGSVQYPNGNLWLTYTAETGKGALYSHSGEVTQSWSRQAELSAPIELQLDQHLVSSTLCNLYELNVCLGECILCPRSVFKIVQYILACRSV